MVKYIQHKDIDFDKYNHCIQNSLTTLLYAESWYLNIETRKRWNILMCNDYQYVMPITYFRLKGSPWKKTFLKPFHAQQLGIVGTEKLTEEIHQEFMHKFFSLNPMEYGFNHSQNAFLEKDKLIKKNNFILDLNHSYEDLFQGFSTSKRSTIRKSLKNNLRITLLDNSNWFISFQKQSLGLNESRRVLNKRKQLIDYALHHNLGKLYGVSKDNKVIAAAFIAVYRDKIYYLQSASNAEGRKMYAIDFLLNDVIEKYANQPFTLDFEGSQIPSVAKFMQRFGAINQPYYLYKRS